MPLPAVLGRRSSPSRAGSRSPRPRFGRYVTAIGANAEAARRAGIAVRRVTLSVYVLTGIAAALAGIIIAARLGSRLLQRRPSASSST